jgi:twinkle protein
MNAAELSLRMADHAEQIAQYLLPQGKKASGEWKAGSISGEPGQSLSVRISGAKKGVWKDFATSEGGDLLDLWCACRAQSLSEAMRDAKAYLGIRDDQPEPPRKTYRRPEKPTCKTPKSRVLEWLEGRGITANTLAAFKIGEQQRNGKTYAVFPYFRDGELVNVKYRNPDDKRDMRQEGEAEPCLFGWHLIEPRARTVAITEGEIDAMTLHQCGIPALSVNAGAGNHQWIENDWARLDRFSEIYLCFDDDEAGQKGVREVSSRLGVERCKIVKFGAKDANQWLMDGAGGEDFHNALKDAKPQDPEEMAQIADFIGQVKSMFYPASDSERFPVLRLGGKDYDWFEFRPAEYTVWTGINGHGKSLMLSQVLLGVVQQGERVMVFSGEMTPATQLKRMVKQAGGVDRPTPDYLDALAQWLRDKVWVFNVVGSATIDRLLSVFGYARRRYGIRQFVIDSLMMTDVPDDGPGSITKQKEAVQKIADFCKRTGSHIHLVAHPRKAGDESRAPGKLDVAGSGKITDAADNVFSVWSARKEESEPDNDKPDALLELNKQRNGEVQHFKLWLYFNKPAQQFCVNSTRRPFCMVPFTGRPHTSVEHV